MRFYAQRGEDERLWELFGGKRQGFYIDVGAHHPRRHSVSKAFYDAGWRGINVEPLPAHAAALRVAQPESVTLQVAASDSSGDAVLFTGRRSPLSTLHHRLAVRGDLSDHITVSTFTLATICHLYARGTIDWLKIDVEGHERQVIEGADWSYRPTVVVIEAVEPRTTTPSHERWEPILLAAGYELLDFDGLNRWYRDAT